MLVKRRVVAQNSVVRGGLGDRYGRHRVLEPKGAFPQQALRLDASLPIYSNEVLIRVDRLNLDSSSFRQMRLEAGETGVGDRMGEIVRERGKMHNPVTNSGGTLLGTVEEIGPGFPRAKFRRGSRIATLVSLTLTPLLLEEIGEVDVSREQVAVRGHAVLFESGLATSIPRDLPEAVVLSVLDVCGAPSLTRRLAQRGDVVAIFGAGKAGLLAAAAVRKKWGKSIRILLLEKSPAAAEAARTVNLADHVEMADLTDPGKVAEAVSRLTRSKMADLVVNCVNVCGTEMASILAAKKSGVVLFFNMATNFQEAVLGAEGIGRQTRLIMGNGYDPGHAALALDLVRKFPRLRSWFSKGDL